ncbi:hypothetical protein KIN20_017409 [Parelaphostrongylus tenuis]|uniref:Uncharacterized protein n=1 Tax=Parelaphostrongylus tenuis TaxID=148309 RepID=A0AAD5N322_PARTN|nr:hypothetical protein KIN20_017409 [Parelaphostrongylus tenuis]
MCAKDLEEVLCLFHTAVCIAEVENEASELSFIKRRWNLSDLRHMMSGFAVMNTAKLFNKYTMFTLLLYNNPSSHLYRPGANNVYACRCCVQQKVDWLCLVYEPESITIVSTVRDKCLLETTL